MNSNRRGAIDSNGNYREKQEPELEEESNADSDEAEFYDGEEPYVEIDEDEELSQEEEQGDIEGIVDKTIQVPDLDEVIKPPTVPDADPESQECLTKRGGLGGTKEVDAQQVEPFTPRLDKKGRPEYYYIPSKDALGKAVNRRAQVFVRPTAPNVKYIRIGLDGDRRYYVDLIDFLRRVVEVGKSNSLDRSKEAEVQLAASVRRYYDADADASGMPTRNVQVNAFGPLAIWDETGAVVTDRPDWFPRRNVRSVRVLGHQLQQYRALIAPKSGGRYTVMSRYIATGILPYGSKLCISFDKDIEQLLDRKVPRQTLRQWLRTVENQINKAKEADGATTPTLPASAVGKDDRRHVILEVGPSYTGTHVPETIDHKSVHLKYYDAHPMDHYRLYLDLELHDKIMALRPKFPPQLQKDEVVDIAPIVEAVLSSDGFNKNDDPYVDPRKTITTHETATCVTTTKYMAACSQKRGQQQNQVMENSSANKVADILWRKHKQTTAPLKSRAEWAHRSGFKMGGLGAVTLPDFQNSQTRENLVFGTCEVNTRMIRYEDCAHRFTERWDIKRWEQSCGLNARQSLDHLFEQAVKKIRDRTQAVSNKNKTHTSGSTGTTTNPAAKPLAVTSNPFGLGYGMSHPHLETRPSDKSLDDIARAWNEYKGGALLRNPALTIPCKPTVANKQETTQAMSKNPVLKKFVVWANLDEAEQIQALSRFLWSTRKLIWKFELHGHTTGFRHAEICTEFDMWDLHVPLAAAARLDLALDTRLWEAGYWEAPIVKSLKVQEVLVPSKTRPSGWKRKYNEMDGAELRSGVKEVRKEDKGTSNGGMHLKNKGRVYKLDL